jgi:nitroimidazol reductase NimA-like FMN-containing flavoprotein (pyridoxamine 5'-phosphate oxidase superfamily)
MTDTDEPLFEGDEESGSALRVDSPDLEARIRHLVEEQPYGVLCLQSHTQPYGVLVAFAFSEDLRQAVFATPVATRKYRILSECGHVALVVDSRPDHPGDFMSVEAVTVTGRATLLERKPDIERWSRLLVTRHHYLESFVAAPSCALFRIDVVRFLHVARFQEVSQWRP